MKWLLLNTLRQRLGIEIVRARKNPGVMDFIENRGINLVLDVGANIGQFGLALRNRGYAGKIISFEPVEEAFHVLSARAASEDKWEAWKVGLGSRKGVMQINVSKNSQFSSFNELDAAGTAFDPDAEFTSSEEVVVTTLDEAVTLDLDGLRVLLKIDTQGYERQVLEGAKETLKHVSGVLLEVPIVIVYKGNWMFDEAIAYMRESGFALAQVHPVNVHTNARDSAVEFDCLFRPIDPTID